jgi:capsule polysaccharide export protein KpsE/RkpR
MQKPEVKQKQSKLQQEVMSKLREMNPKVDSMIQRLNSIRSQLMQQRQQGQKGQSPQQQQN